MPTPSILLTKFFYTKAFTLIELVITIVLLGILSTVALPRFFALSTDAKRTSNQSIASALNTAHAQFSLKARLPKNALSPKNTYPSASLDPVINSIELEPIDVDPNLPSGSALMLFFAKPNYTLIGAAQQALRDTSGYLLMQASSGTSGHTFSQHNISIACAEIFQALLGDNAPSVVTGRIVPLSGTGAINGGAYPNKTIDYQALYVDATPGNILSPTGVPANTFTVRRATSNADLGSCLYVLNSSIFEKIVFYIYYDANTGVFTALEADN